MVTKLRSFSTRIGVKISLILLFIAALLLSCYVVAMLAFAQVFPGSIFMEDYKDWLEVYGEFDTDSVGIALNNLGVNEYYDFLSDGEFAVDEMEKILVNMDYYVELTDGRIFQSEAVSKAGGKAFFGDQTAGKMIFSGMSHSGWHSEGNIFGSHPINIVTEGKYTAIKDAVFVPRQDVFAAKEAAYFEMRPLAIRGAIVVGALVIAALLFLVCLALISGKKPRDKDVHLCIVDRVYSDVLIAVGFICITIICILTTEALYYVGIGNMKSPWIALALLCVGLCLGIFLVMFLSIVRKIKAKKLLKHSLIYVVLHFIYKVCYKVYDLFRSLFDGRAYKNSPLTKKLFYSQLAFIAGSGFAVVGFCLGMFLPPLFLLPLIGEIVLIYWYIKGNNETFDEINDGINEGLEEQMRAERMKINLVTNVSHDLKTPLTSIISYVELLSYDETLSAESRDYVSILAEKSDRLKHIVADLFDLAKATSGNIPLDIEELDLKKLVEQTVADMQDKIDSSGVIMKLTLPGSPIMADNDGKKLYRVLQNIFDNALKYSVEKTRVFIEIASENGFAEITVKNTASYEMDFTADEVLQRFNRGDKSRTTDGSGLGLSIAQSFTIACGGDFDVKIDGDLFKVTIKLKTK